MVLDAKDLQLLCQQAISAARQAGQIISQHRHQSVTVSHKKGGASLASQVVTEVDHLCQDIILQSLLPTCATFNLALLTEETPDDLMRLEKDYFWCIDPLDGTLSFIESTPGYAISIALVSRDGSAHIGVIYDPVELTLYHAVKGYGAFRNGRTWVPESLLPSSRQSLTLIFDRSFARKSLFPGVVEKLKNRFMDAGYKDFNTILHGGAAMNACWVLEKAPACYFKLPKREDGGGSLWDYAATACLFHEAGAVASDIYGQPLDLNRADSTFLNHRGLLYASDHDLARRVMDCYTRLETD